MIVSDYIAEWLEEKDVRHCFGIIGAGNAALFDAISRRGFTSLVCTHHEQAATMACIAYYRTNSKMAVSLVTTGGGSANAITGVVSAYLDSIPTFTISGNEAREYTEGLNSHWRGWGVQGIPIIEMVAPVTKWAKRMRVSRQVYYLNEAYEAALEGRPGPVWIDVPRDIQNHAVPQES